MTCLWLMVLIEPLKVEVTQLPAPEHHSVLISILAVLGTLLWVIFAIYAVWVFKEPLSQFLISLPEKLKKLSFAGFEVEFAQQAPVVLDPYASNFGQLTKEDAAQQSYIRPLIIEARKDPVPHSYITIDLGNGHKWLTSRLYIFALMFHRMRAVSCFVFVDNSHGVLNQYIGTASTEAIPWALAMRYPWLERAFAKAYNDAISQVQFDSPSFITSPSGRLPDFFVLGTSQLDEQVVRNYVEGLRKSPDDPSITDSKEWTPVRSEKPPTAVLEHAVWIDSARLLADFKDILWTERVPDLFDEKTKVRAIINSQDPYIALTRASGEFVSLLERTRVLADFAKNITAQLDQGS